VIVIGEINAFDIDALQCVAVSIYYYYF